MEYVLASTRVFSYIANGVRGTALLLWRTGAICGNARWTAINSGMLVPVQQNS